LTEYPDLWRNLERGVAEQTPDVVRRAAHTLKSSMAHLGAGAARDLAQSLEAMGQQADMAAANDRLRELEAQMSPVLARLKRFVV